MNWRNLKKNQCPVCDKKFEVFEKLRIICPCGFFITQERFKEIVLDQIKKEIDEWGEPKEESRDIDDIL